MTPDKRGRNHLLCGLDDADWTLLSPYLEPINLPYEKRIEIRNTPLEWVYFIDDGIASVIGEAPQTRRIETGIIGYEGATCLGTLLGDPLSGQTIVMQVKGRARRIAAGRFVIILNELPSLRDAMLPFVRAFMLQAAQTAVANGCAQITPRLARWLVMLHDRLEVERIKITHQYIAIMLAVTRSGVSLALKALERDELIVVKRGSVTILNRDGLISKAEGLYGVTERHYQRLLGWKSRVAAAQSSDQSLFVRRAPEVPEAPALSGKQS